MNNLQETINSQQDLIGSLKRKLFLAECKIEELGTVSIISNKRCLWTFDADTSSWDTSCNGKFTFFEGSPTENSFQYCPYCGGYLDIVISQKS